MPKKMILQVALIALIGVGYLYGRGPIERFLGLTPANLSTKVADVTLTNGAGESVNFSSYQGKWLVVFFGYTNCPDVCPLSLSYASREFGRLGSYQDKVQVLFVSVDPERDIAEKVGPYVNHFNKSFVGLTGQPEALNSLARSFEAGYSKNKSTSALGYLMTHSSDFFILDGEGRLRRRLHPPHEAGMLSGALLNFLSGGSS